ncbi:unnamed protein product [marine sediment metagenome]|uniref:Protein kinase domain-containing protein n=1 Tax=marine sediment metagenome TaxID=412755 RepID=X1TEU1_9ZZZZ
MANKKINQKCSYLRTKIEKSKKILDVDQDSMWYVSQFYENGTLADNRDIFKGDFVKSLKAIRPLVEAVATLHKKSYVHRAESNTFWSGWYGLFKEMENN